LTIFETLVEIERGCREWQLCMGDCALLCNIIYHPQGKSLPNTW